MGEWRVSRWVELWVLVCNLWVDNLCVVGVFVVCVNVIMVGDMFVIYVLKKLFVMFDGVCVGVVDIVEFFLGVGE